MGGDIHTAAGHGPTSSFGDSPLAAFRHAVGLSQAEVATRWDFAGLGFLDEAIQVQTEAVAVCDPGWGKASKPLRLVGLHQRAVTLSLGLELRRR